MLKLDKEMRYFDRVNVIKWNVKNYIRGVFFII